MALKGCLKLATTFYSFLVLIGGVSTGLGVWSQMKSKIRDVVNTDDDTILTKILALGPWMLIAPGCVFILMGVVGCLGTLKKKRWMILVFFITMLIIFILQVFASVFILLPSSVKEKSLASVERKAVKSLQEKYGHDDTVTSVWNETMSKLNCCGYNGYDDFTNSTLKDKPLYPPQCCGQAQKCGKDKAAEKKVRGCIHVLLDINLPLSGPLMFLIGILEIIALVVSLKVYQCLGRVPDLPDII